MEKKRLLVIGMLVLFLVGGSFYNFWQKNTAVNKLEPEKSGNEVTEETAAVKKKNEQQPDIVYVSGAVQKPGVFSLPQGSRVMDAVTAAGGARIDADVIKINLAEKTRDGMHIHLQIIQNVQNQQRPAGEAKSGQGGSKIAEPMDSGTVSINAANEAELDKLPGVGPAMAKRIVEYRQANGGFQTLEDLKKVSGIGEAKYKRIKDKITL